MTIPKVIDDMQFTFANLLAIVMAAISIAYSWGSLGERVHTVEVGVAAHTVKMDEMGKINEQLARIETRLEFVLQTKKDVVYVPRPFKSK